MIKRLTAAILTIFIGFAAGTSLAFFTKSASAAEPVHEPYSVSHSVSSEQSSSSSENIEAEALIESGYYICEYNGKIAIMKDKNSVPEMIFDINTKLLPEIDRENLKNGIYVKSYDELVRAIEDYIS